MWIFAVPFEELKVVHTRYEPLFLIAFSGHAGAKSLHWKISLRTIIAVLIGAPLMRSQIGICGLKMRVFKMRVPLLGVFISDFSPKACVSSEVHHSGIPLGNFSFCHSSSFFLIHGCASLTCVWGEMLSAFTW